MTDIKRGDYIFIPKGTKLMPHYFGGKQVFDVTTRDTTAKVSYVRECYSWKDMLSEDEREAYYAEGGNRYGGTTYVNGKEPAVDTKYKAIVRAAYGELTEVHWSDKSALVGFVQKVDKPEPKSKAPKQPTIRQQMVPGSKWKFTQDIDIVGEVGNPAHDAEYRRLRDVMCPHGLRGPEYAEAWKAFEIAVAAISIPKVLPHPIASFKVGDAFEVTAKFTQYAGYVNYHSIQPPAGIGALWVPIKLNNGRKGLVPFGSIKDIIEPESIPTVDVYVLRDKATGQYFKTTDYYSDRQACVAEMVDDFMGAKHFDGVGRVKTSILSFTGYFDGLPGSENLPEWMGGRKQIDLPPTWEVVHFDKLMRKEVATFDIQDWYKRTWELRALTVKFGSAVRSLYNDLEKKDELDTYKGMVIFRKEDHDAYYGDKSAFEDHEIQEINEALANAGFTGTKTRRAKAFDSVAVSFSDARVAMLFKLSYNGTLPCKVINLQSMKEEVGDA